MRNLHSQRNNLSKEAEVALIKRARLGDVDARNTLMEAYYSIARDSCRRHARRKGVSLEDADSEVFFAISEAIFGYDLRRKVPFAAYLDQRARGAVTWADREARKQDLRKLTEEYEKRFGGSGPPGKGREVLISKERPPKKATLRDGRIGQYIYFTKWPEFERWLKNRPSRNDRLIARWLWMRTVPMTQAEIARKLGISRSAVCQRRKSLIFEILRTREEDLKNQLVKVSSLNNFSDDCYLDMDFD